MGSHNNSDSHGNHSSGNHSHNRHDHGLGWDFYSKKVWNKASSALGGSTKPGFPHYGSALTYREPVDLLAMDNELMENNLDLLAKIGWANGSTMNDFVVRPYMVRVPDGDVEFRYGVDLGWYDTTEKNNSIEMVPKPNGPNRMALIGEDNGNLNNDNLVYQGDMNAVGRYFSRIETLRADLRRYITEDDYTTNERAQRFRDMLNSSGWYPAAELKALAAFGDDEFIAATAPDLGLLIRGHPYTDASREAAEHLGIRTKDFKARVLDEEIGHMHGFYRKSVVENEAGVRDFLAGFYRSEAARFRHSNPEYARAMERLAAMVEAEAKHTRETNSYGHDNHSSLDDFIDELQEKIESDEADVEDSEETDAENENEEASEDNSEERCGGGE